MSRGGGRLGLHEQQNAGSVDALGAVERGVDPIERGRLPCAELGQPLGGSVAAGQFGPWLEVVVAADDVNVGEDDRARLNRTFSDVRVVLAVTTPRLLSLNQG